MQDADPLAGKLLKMAALGRQSLLAAFYPPRALASEKYAPPQAGLNLGVDFVEDSFAFRLEPWMDKDVQITITGAVMPHFKPYNYARMKLLPINFRQQLYSNGRNTVSQGHRVHRFRGSKAQCGPCPLRSQCFRNPDKSQTKQIGFRVQARPKDTVLERMKARIDSALGRDCFTLRGRSKVRAQWQLYSLMLNIGKLHSSGKMAA